MSLDLEHHLVFYGTYHQSRANVAIHLVCVPVILFSGFCLASYSGPLVELPSWLTVPYLDLNLGTIAAVLYSALYLLLEPVAGLTLGGICIAAAAGGNYLRALDPDNTLVSATAAHIVCWLIQLVGNSFSSSKTGRSPALLENLVRTLFLSPMYVWLKVLFALGYRPELQARVRAKVQAELQKTKPKSK